MVAHPTELVIEANVFHWRSVMTNRNRWSHPLHGLICFDLLEMMWLAYCWGDEALRWRGNVDRAGVGHVIFIFLVLQIPLTVGLLVVMAHCVTARDWNLRGVI